MLGAVREKASFAAAIPALDAAGRVSGVWLAFASVDAAWLVLSVAAYLRTPKANPGGRGQS
jgi:hypothetical protein